MAGGQPRAGGSTRGEAAAPGGGRSRWPRAAVLAVLAFYASTPPAAPALELQRGHAKLRGQLARFPGDSLYRTLVGATAADGGGALRLNLGGRRRGLSFGAHYQLLAVTGEAVELASAFPDPALAQPVLPLDGLRWLDLSQTLQRDDSQAVVQRLDRLQLTWTGERTVLRAGRQALSWGNGLFFNPMDFFNPFDPAAIDREYKTGDDMLYGQYLLDSGSDWQAVAVQRRDARGEAGDGARSSALKYHGFAGAREFDLLLARHFEQTLLGIGGSSSIGGAVLRGDLLLTDARDGWTASAVLNASWSWRLLERNMSGSLEYFYSGFGLRESDYGAAAFLRAPDLVARLRRGELYTVGRHYLAGSVQIELHPLLNLSPALFWNLGDQSALAQLSLRWDLGAGLQLLAAGNLPFGSANTEYGGLELPLPPPRNRLAPGASATLQLAFYF